MITDTFSLFLQYRRMLFEGIGNTFYLFFSIIYLSLCIGFVLFLMKHFLFKDSFILFLLNGLTYFTISLPPYVYIVFITFYFFPANDFYNMMAIGVYSLSILHGCTLSYDIKIAFFEIPLNQWILGKILGIQRAKFYFKIIIPQVIFRLVPRFFLCCKEILKNISLLSICGIPEFTNKTCCLVSLSKTSYFLFLFTVLFYGFFSFAIDFFLQLVERKILFKIQNNDKR